jgi:hypothetical protein
MRGALKITFHDGSHEFFEVDPIGSREDFVERFRAFLGAPNVSLVLENEILVIPGTSIREISITRSRDLPAKQLAELPGVLVGARRVLG